MWLKAMTVYRLKVPEGKTQEEWKEGLLRQVGQTCPSNAALSYGWGSAFKDETKELVASVAGSHVVQFVLSTRLLPQDVVRQTVADRVAEIEASQGFPVPKKEQRRMQDEVHFELLPKAFVQQKSVTVCWHEASGLVMIGATQAALLESFITCWTHCLPGWQLKPLESKRSVERSLTAWLKQEERLPEGLSWGDACSLVDPQDRGCSIRFAGNELASNTVSQHLDDGMMVKQAALIWKEKLRFVIASGMALSQIKALDVETEYESGQSKDEQIAMDIALMAPLYAMCMQDVCVAFECENQEEQEANKPALVEDYA